MRVLVTVCVSAFVSFMLTFPANTGITWPPDPADDVITVCSSGCDHTSIQAAVDSADPGDTILLGPDTFYENVVIGTDVSIIGAGREQTVVDGRGTGVVFANRAELTLAHMTIQNGSWQGAPTIGAGGVHSYAWEARKLVIHDCVVRDNSDLGVLTQKGLKLSSSVVSNNSWAGILDAGYGSGVAVTDSLITGHSHYGLWTGMYYPMGENRIENSTITDNGTGVFITNGDLIVENSTVAFNKEVGVRNNWWPAN
jgi:hypothetical protein